MSRVGHADYDTANAAARAAWDEEVRVRGRVTNMKRTLLLSEPAYAAYMGWYPLWDELERLVGHRAAAVFAHAISARNNCVLCTVYFRRELIEAGLSPEAFAPTPDETLLIQLAEHMAEGPHANADATWTALKARFAPAELVAITAFAGMMIAVNVFNTALRVDVDEHLQGFVPPLALSAHA